MFQPVRPSSDRSITNNGRKHPSFTHINMKKPKYIPWCKSCTKITQNQNIYLGVTIVQKLPKPCGVYMEFHYNLYLEELKGAVSMKRCNKYYHLIIIICVL
jgi:hypothetical protein